MKPFNKPVYRIPTQEESLKKWDPILKALNITDDRMKQIMADYAEHTQSMDVGQDIVTNPTFLLPVNMKVMSQLKLEDRNVVFLDNSYWKNKKRTDLIDSMLENKEIVEDIKKEFRVQIRKDQIEEIAAVLGPDNMDIVQRLESVLTQNLVDYINKELETKQTLYVTRLVDNISMEAVEEKPIEMVLTTFCTIE